MQGMIGTPISRFYLRGMGGLLLFFPLFFLFYFCSQFFNFEAMKINVLSEIGMKHVGGIPTCGEKVLDVQIYEKGQKPTNGPLEPNLIVNSFLSGCCRLVQVLFHVFG